MQMGWLVTETGFLNLCVDFLLFQRHKSQQMLQPGCGFHVLQREGCRRARGRRGPCGYLRIPALV